ncbi:hypothetical protein VIBNIFTn2_1350002 [Vibrio nigripulchritudo FTn2]|uniref:hypothetical protein n=1 Tax=Vibrio nigripulchritudo TaxID=28173 RepID=UPI0003B2115D|nr:hypothetical protein [Vibrio nigripulchritudo]BCL74162.1 hypothetical protein VNTUMSATTG_60990 [Vibrio nigripulchritudo]CCN40622.1 hypothetical protein VIBNIFTn2_1350002 [Vibrio nigripulchritudo FTn2]
MDIELLTQIASLEGDALAWKGKEPLLESDSDLTQFLFEEGYSFALLWHRCTNDVGFEMLRNIERVVQEFKRYDVWAKTEQQFWNGLEMQECPECQNSQGLPCSTHG